MRKYEYLYRLEKALKSMPDAEREAAMRYYEEYFEDAGAENEQAVINELGNPEQLARAILDNEEKASGGSSRYGATSADEDITDMNLPVFHSIKGKLINATVTVERGDRAGLVWRRNGDSSTTFEYRVSDGVLQFAEKQRQKKWVFNISFGGSNELILYLPEEQYNSFELSNVNGGIKISGAASKTMDIGTVNGSMKLDQVEADKMKLHGVNGSIKAYEIRTRSLNAETVNGSIRLSGELDGNVNLNTVNGSLKTLTSLPIEDYNFKMSTWGSIHINGKKVGNESFGRSSTTIENGSSREFKATAMHGSITVESSGEI